MSVSHVAHPWYRTRSFGSDSSVQEIAGEGVFRTNPLEETEWDTLVSAFPNHSFFHSAAWARVLRDTYGYSPVYFTVRDSEGFKAVLPLMEVRSWLTGTRGVSLPFTDECDPLCFDSITYRRLFQEAMEYGGRNGWKYLECRGGVFLLPEASPSTSFYSHHLILKDDEETLFKEYHTTLRQTVRKARKSGMTVEISTGMDAVRDFYKLQAGTRRKHGLPPQPFRFFQKIHEHVLSANHGFVVIVRHMARPIAGAVFFHMGKRAVYKYAASDEKFRNLGGSPFAVSEAIKWYVHHGFERLDFGRTSLENEGLRQFKQKWGTQEEQLDYMRYQMKTGDFVQVGDEVFGWHNRVFQTMPPFASRLVGRALYKHVA